MIVQNYKSSPNWTLKISVNITLLNKKQKSNNKNNKMNKKRKKKERKNFKLNLNIQLKRNIFNKRLKTFHQLFQEV